MYYFIIATTTPTTPPHVTIAPATERPRETPGEAVTGPFISREQAEAVAQALYHL